jgi:farnesyl-diphosphate farnesyltransferase
MPERLPRMLQQLLEGVSRSFYLTVRVLPGAVRPQISLAYLLARASDTIADTTAVAVGRRREALLELRAAVRDSVEGRKTAFRPAVAAALSCPGPASGAERLLLESVDAILGAMSTLPDSDRLLIGAVLDTISQGQESDLVRFGAATRRDILALESDADLDWYTYSVAGCVGEFWTHICRLHLFPAAVLDDAQLLADAARFGKGLQLVNILRDLAADLSLGRCYIPRVRLATLGLAPHNLLDPEIMDRFRPLYEEYLKLAGSYLAAGWRYTVTLPSMQVRVRLACAWPVLIGVRTLARLGSANVLDPANRIKVSRREVRQLILSSVIRYPNRAAWDRLFQRAAAPCAAPNSTRMTSRR